MTCHPATPSQPSLPPDEPVSHELLRLIHERAFFRSLWLAGAALALLVATAVADDGSDLERVLLLTCLIPVGLWAYHVGKADLSDRLMRAIRHREVGNLLAKFHRWDR